MRGKWAPKRFHRNANDWLPEWMRETLCRRQAYPIHSVICSLTATISEIAFVGKAPGSYLMLLGGGYHGQRLNKIYRGEQI